MDDFDSSDIEFEPPSQNPFYEAGKMSVMKMMDHALDDRIASKKQLKQLTFAKGSPATQYIHALWWNRFNSFRCNTLNKGVELLPSSEDLERFFTTIVSRVVPRTNQVPSYSWLKSAVGFTVENCIFHHKTFTLTAHERLRIASLLDTLLQEGKITQDPSWTRQWAGVVIVRKLVCSLINQAYKEGTTTWDITLAKCLSIVLVASLGARTGDVTVAPRDKHTLPYLAYKDVVIKMKKGGSTIDDLDAVITLRNEKGNKLDPKSNRIVLLSALKSSSDSMVCPIKLLLTLALRLGNVAETSIDDLVMHTAQRRNRTVLWSFPERPVLCAFSGAGTAVKVEKPAGNHQLTDTMGQASLAGGMLSPLHAHDLRRGAARDAANLSSKGKGVANKVTTTVLGHSLSKANLQLTAHYVGAYNDDVWTKRVDENFVDTIYDLPEAENAYPRKFQSLKAEEITEACLSEGLDHQDPKDRGKASKKLEKRRRANWVDQETRKRQMLAADSPYSLPSRGDTLVAPPEQSANADIMDAVQQADESNIDPQLANIDPQLAQDCNDLCNIMIGSEDGAAHPAVQELLLDSVQTGATFVPTQESLEQSDGLTFVRHFSTINISCNQGLQQWGIKESAIEAREKILARIQGNSRDDVTEFIYKCKNHTHGCPYGNGNRVEVARHELTCNITSPEIFEQLEQKDAAKAFPCTEEGCPKSFDTVGKRNRHVKDMHGWPKPCPKGCKEGDDDGVDLLFDTRHALNRHMETHSEFTPTKCLVPGCTSDTIFTRSKQYRKHIQQTHHVVGKAIDQYMPYTKKAKWEPTTCRLPNCTSQATFNLPNRYKAHLRDWHKMDDVQVEQAMAQFS